MAEQKSALITAKQFIQQGKVQEAWNSLSPYAGNSNDVEFLLYAAICAPDIEKSGTFFSRAEQLWPQERQRLLGTTYYDLMGITENATEPQISQAFQQQYRTLQFKVSDPNPTVAEQAQRQLRWLNDGRALLLDRARRQQYDQNLQANKSRVSYIDDLMRNVKSQIEKHIGDAMQSAIQAGVQSEMETYKKTREAQVQERLGGCAQTAGSLIMLIIGSLVCGFIGYGSFNGVLWIAPYSFFVSLSALLGVIPIAGQYLHFQLVTSQIQPWFYEASGLEGSWVITVIFLLSFIQNISMSFQVILFLISLFSGGNRK